MRVRVDYDLASTLCYVATRCMGRLADELAAAGVTLDWEPIDLSTLTVRLKAEFQASNKDLYSPRQPSQRQEHSP